MVFQTNGTTEAMRITAAQNVGIGTNNPATKAEIYGTASAQNLALRVTNTATDGYSTIQLGDANAGIYRNGSTQTGYGGASSLNLITVGAHNIGFSTGNTLRMVIDSAGCVTMPYQPAFHAVRTGGNVSSTGIFICNTVTYNDGNHYNSSTGRFTAPVAGRYQMNFFVLAQNGNNFDFAIRVNGSQYPGMDIRCNGGAIGGNFTLSCSAIFKLSAGDIVDPFIAFYGSGPVYGQGLNAFSMYLLG
jgi:hypothetical protein